MALLQVWLRAELRRRWRVQVGLALLIGLVGAVALSLASGARATTTAYDRYLGHGAVPDLEMDAVPAPIQRQLVARPEVVGAGTYSAIFATPNRKGLQPGNDFIVFAAADRAWGRTIDRPIVVAGRLPRPDAADEVVVNEAGRSLAHLRVGGRTALASLGAEDLDPLRAGHFDQIKGDGPTPTVRVVGVVRTRLDLGHASFAKAYLLAGVAFQRAYAPRMAAFPPELDVRLRHPGDAARFVAAAGALMPEAQSQGGIEPSRVADSLASLRDATRVQALALVLVALAAGVAGLVVLAQAIGRSVAAFATDFPVLQALGVQRSERARLAALSFAPGIAAGTVLALVGATVASRWFPTGVARQTGPPPQVRFDASTLLPGVAVLVAVVIAAAIVSALRWRPVPLEGADTATRVGALARLAAALPPAPRTGLRWALPRRDLAGARNHTAIAGAVLGVMAVVGAFLYSTTLHHLVSTPAAYGWTFDVNGGGGSDVAQTLRLRDTLLRDRDVGDVALARVTGHVLIGGASVVAYGFEAVRGRIEPAVLEGRAPVTPDEVVLATKTARQLRRRVGDPIIANGTDGRRVPLRVVGLGLVPTIESDRIASGAALTRQGLERLASSSGYVDVLFRFAPGVDHERAVARLRPQDTGGGLPSPPGDVLNVDRVRSYPLWLAAFLGLLGALAVLHALLSSVRRRAHQVAVLQAIGFTRGQVAAAVSTQGATMTAVGVVLGVPLGAVVGRWTWALSAHRMGVSEHAVSPITAIVAVLAGTLVALAAIGAVTGWWSGRSSPARALRTP